MKIKIIALLTLLLAVSCGGDSSKGGRKLETPTAVLRTQSDSLAYVIGVSMAQNILKTDSLIDLTVVGAAIAQYGQGKSLFSIDNARATYLKYLLHIEPERQRAYEDKYLRELAAKDRSYTRTRSGILYNISVIGNESLIPRNNNDWVNVHYTISRMDGGELLFSTYESGESLKGGLSTLPLGLIECVKLIGKGGKLSALIPSKFAYDTDGNEELSIEPFETLRYDIELVNVDRNGATKRAVVRDPAKF